MTFWEFLEVYTTFTRKEMTALYNSFSVEDRIAFLEILSPEQKIDFVKDIRTQAVQNFWTHEQELLKQRLSTRNWTP